MFFYSVRAVVAGLLFSIAVTTLIDFVLVFVGLFNKLGSPIDHGMAALALVYRFAAGILGAALSARLAPFSPSRHAFVLAVVFTTLGLIGMVVTWDSGLAPHWFTAAIPILGFPQSLVGLFLHNRTFPRKPQKSVELLVKPPVFSSRKKKTPMQKPKKPK